MSAPPTHGRVTALEPQQRSPNRLSVFLDGTFAFGLDARLALDAGLHIGDELDETRVAALLATEEVSRATEAALRLLAHRPRAARELRDRLRQKDFTPAAIDTALDRLVERNYVDDAAFARTWVENRTTHRPRGRRLLAEELRAKGVDRQTIDETLATTEIDEAQAAFELAEAKLRSYTGLEPAVARRRLAAYLTRRGYGFDIIKPILDQLVKAE